MYQEWFKEYEQTKKEGFELKNKEKRVLTIIVKYNIIIKQN